MNMSARYPYGLCFVAAAGLLTLALPAFGQGTVTIFGTVTDPAGAAIPGVSITALHKETGTSRQATTGAAGEYVLTRLPIGTWTVKAESSGFRTFVQDNVQVQVDENRQVNIGMTLGAVNESVTVQAEARRWRQGRARSRKWSTRRASTVASERAQSAATAVSRGRIRRRRYSGPGAERIWFPSTARAPTRTTTRWMAADNHDPYFESPSVFPNPDALEEFSLQTNAYSADRGRNAGALMNAVSRSGTNQFHGTASNSCETRN